MELLTKLVVLLVALLHGYFLVLEMFLWDKPKGMKVFGLTPEKAAVTKVMAANQPEIGLTSHDCNRIKLRVCDVQLWLGVLQLIGDKPCNHIQHKAMNTAVPGVFYL